MSKEDQTAATKTGADASSTPWLSAPARGLLDRMPAPFVALDDGLCVVFANRALTERWGDIVGRHVSEFWPEAPFRRALETGEAESFQHADSRLDVYRDGDGLHAYFREASPAREGDFEGILAALPHIAWMTDANGMPTYVNPRWSAYTGLSGATRDDFRSSLHPDDLARVIEANQEARETAQPTNYRLRVRRHDGEFRWFEVRTAPLPGSGRPARLIGTSTDVHEEHLAREALRESEARLASIVENIGDAFFALDREYRFVVFNPHAERFLNVKSETVLGRVCWEAFPGSVGTDMERCTRRAMETRQPQREELVSPKTGRWVEIQVYPWLDGLITFERDMTDRRQAQDALRRSEHRQRFLLEMSDAVGRETSAEEIVRVACRMLGEELQVARCGYAVVYGDEDRFVVEHDHTRGVPSIAGTYRLSEFSGNEQARYLRGEPIVVPDTSLDPVTAPHYETVYKPFGVRATASVPLLRNGVWVASFALQHNEPRDWTEDEIRLLRDSAARVWDAVERVRAERTVREANENLERVVEARTAELQIANRQLEGFTYHVSHDLRGPLRAIVSTSRIVVEDFGEALPPEGRDLLASQAKAAGKLAQLMDDLLKLSRLSREAIGKQTVDLTQIAIEAAAEARSAHPNSSTSVVVEKAMEAFADPRLAKLALHNLIENAIKYSPQGGNVTVGRRNDGAYFVSDEGIGIDPRYFGKIFEPFERLHRDDEFRGTGIGLANVRQIVERHGGRVWVESEPGRGSAFCFTL